ncbi:MAG: L,D-transpeptidase [Polyangiaceae bacterium]|nr:L,D-transpeptidase [Polyangiaceae bacterium]
MRARGLIFVSAFLVPSAGVFFVPKEQLTAVSTFLSTQISAEKPVAPTPTEPPANPAPKPVQVPGPSIHVQGVGTAMPDSIPGQSSSQDPTRDATQTGADPSTYTTLPAALIDDGSDDLPALELEPEPPAPEPPKNSPKSDKPTLSSTARETWVFAEPRWASRKLGYLRAGASVERKAKPAGFTSCPEGWYKIKPHGYVCANELTSLDSNHPVVVASATRPKSDGLPYVYVMGRFPTPPFYTRLPSKAEQQKVENDLANALRKAALLAKDPSFVAPPEPDAIPSFLENGSPLPGLANTFRPRDAVTVGRARVRSGFALLGTYEHEGRRFGLTTDLTLIPLDRTRVVKPSAFHGVKLDETVNLPMAFVRSKHAFRYTQTETGAIVRGEPIAHREGVPITDVVKRAGGVTYLQAKDGSFVAEEQVVRVDRFKKAPAWATAGRKWVDVSILKQSLVAYEGEKPVYVTLVSTGADGIGDPKKTHSTIQGAFLIHTKHVTVTMDGDTAGDEFDFRDVPFVQYFTEGFALHAAYWHDEFGTPRSHGCVNLAPIDAAWLFGWTDPPVPEGWHAALSLKRGTLVYTHP